MARNSAVKILDVTSSASTVSAVATVLAANGVQWRAAGAGSTYSTLTTANDVNVKLDADDRIGFLVSWCCTQDAAPVTQTLSVSAGSARGAWRNDVGAYTLNLCTAAHSTATKLRKWILGPFEGARFAQTATSTAAGVKTGHRYVTFTMAVNTSAAQSAKAGILPFRWPDVSYTT